MACFPHGCWPCPPPRATHANGKTAQVRRPSSCLCSWTGVNKWGVGLTLERTRRSKVTVRGTVGSLSRCLKGHCSRHLGLWRVPPNHQHSQLGTETLTQAWKSGLHHRRHGDAGQRQPAPSQTAYCGSAHRRGRGREVACGKRQLWAAESRGVSVSPEEKPLL